MGKLPAHCSTRFLMPGSTALSSRPLHSGGQGPRCAAGDEATPQCNRQQQWPTGGQHACRALGPTLPCPSAPCLRFQPETWRLPCTQNAARPSNGASAQPCSPPPPPPGPQPRLRAPRRAHRLKSASFLPYLACTALHSSRTSCRKSATVAKSAGRAQQRKCATW